MPGVGGVGGVGLTVIKMQVSVQIGLYNSTENEHTINFKNKVLSPKNLLDWIFFL